MLQEVDTNIYSYETLNGHKGTDGALMLQEVDTNIYSYETLNGHKGTDGALMLQEVDTLSQPSTSWSSPHFGRPVTSI